MCGSGLLWTEYNIRWERCFSSAGLQHVKLLHWRGVRDWERLPPWAELSPWVRAESLVDSQWESIVMALWITCELAWPSWMPALSGWGTEGYLLLLFWFLHYGRLSDLFMGRARWNNRPVSWRPGRQKLKDKRMLGREKSYKCLWDVIKTLWD